MTIQAALSDGLVDVGIADTTLVTGILNRKQVTWAALHNTATTERTVGVYVSNSTTSAAGDRVNYITLAAGETLPIDFIIGQSYTSGEYVLAKATSGSGGDVTGQVTYTNYTGDD